MAPKYYDPVAAPYYDPVSLRRVALVTGGNGGIGWFTVLHLYLHGYVVYIAGRSTKRIEAAIKDIETEAANRIQNYSQEERAERPLGQLKYVLMDLLDLASVEKAVGSFLRQQSQLDLLVENAGVMALPFSLTGDGFEIQMQTNYIAHVLLLELLLPTLEKSHHGRLVYLSSIGHMAAFRKFPPDSWFNHHPNIIFTWLRYGLAKTFGIQYVKVLAIKKPQILSIAVHPGFVMNTNLFAYWTRLPIVGVMFWVFFQIFGWLFGVSTEVGSLATLKAAMSPELTTEKDNGKYFATGGLEAQPSKLAKDTTYALESYSWAIEQLRSRGFRV